MRNALSTSEMLQCVSWRWEMFTLSGITPAEETREFVQRLVDQNCGPAFPAVFLVLTGGKGEDAWTPVANGVIDLGDQANVDPFDFVAVDTEDDVCAAQRYGRLGRLFDSLMLRRKVPTVAALKG